MSLLFSAWGVPKSPFIFSVIGLTAVVLYFVIVVIERMPANPNKEMHIFLAGAVALFIVIISIIIANPQTSNHGTLDIFDFVPFLPFLLN